MIKNIGLKQLNHWFILLLTIVSIRNMCAYIDLAELIRIMVDLQSRGIFIEKKYYPSHSCRTPHGLYPL